MKDVIQKLLTLGWEPAPYSQPEEKDFYVWKVFEISQARELSNYIDYTPKDDELIYVMYKIYPHLRNTCYCIYTDDDPYDVIYEVDEFDTVLDLALRDRLFTYQCNGCKNCKYNKIRTVRDKECRKGHRALFGFGCRDYEPYDVGYQINIYDLID